MANDHLNIIIQFSTILLSTLLQESNLVLPFLLIIAQDLKILLVVHECSFLECLKWSFTSRELATDQCECSVYIFSELPIGPMLLATMLMGCQLSVDVSITLIKFHVTKSLWIYRTLSHNVGLDSATLFWSCAIALK